jgi:hypothetical protein
MSRSSGRTGHPTQLVVGIAAAAALCLWGSFESYGVETAYQRQFRDPYLIGAQFSRLAPMLSAVPESAVIGYLTDAQPGSTTDSAMFGGAVYVLAPRLLVRGADHDWVLGNFTRPADFAALGRTNGLRLHQDFGDGVVLFQREPRR